MPIGAVWGRLWLVRLVRFSRFETQQLRIDIRE
jgi:hypothetical protein